MTGEESAVFFDAYKKMLEGFSEGLENHKSYHWNLISGYESIIHILNDALNGKLRTIEVKQGQEVVSKSIDFLSYQNETLHKIADMTKQSKSNPIES